MRVQVGYGVHFIKVSGFKGDNFKESQNSSYQLHGQVLDVVTSARYLEVEISSDFSWNSHIDRITAIANSMLSFKKKNPSKQKMQMSERLPITHLYALSWSTLPHFGNHTKEKMLQLKKS